LGSDNKIFIPFSKRLNFRISGYFVGPLSFLLKVRVRAHFVTQIFIDTLTLGANFWSVTQVNMSVADHVVDFQPVSVFRAARNLVVYENLQRRVCSLCIYDYLRNRRHAHLIMISVAPNRESVPALHIEIHVDQSNNFGTLIPLRPEFHVHRLNL